MSDTFHHASELTVALSVASRETRSHVAGELRRELGLALSDCHYLTGWPDVAARSPKVAQHHVTHAYKELRRRINLLNVDAPRRVQLRRLLGSAGVPRATGADLGLCEPASLDTSCLVGGGVDE